MRAARAARPKSAPAAPGISPLKVRSNRCVMQMTTQSETAGVTNARYWDKAAADWDDIHDTFKTELRGFMKRALASNIGSTNDVIDFGCGGGRYIAYTASRCKHVLGLDISAALLEIARAQVVERKRLRNVDLRVADIGANGSIARLALPACDIAICTNVLLSPEPITVANILRLIAHSVRIGGRLILLVPAVASAINIRSQHRRWLAERRRRDYERDDDEEAAEASNPSDERRGVFQRLGVRTQHFRLTELQVMLRQHGFGNVLTAERVEYSWNTEFDAPTKFLDKDPAAKQPFDWLVVAERTPAEPATDAPSQPARAKSAWRMASAVASTASVDPVAVAGSGVAADTHGRESCGGDGDAPTSSQRNAPPLRRRLASFRSVVVISPPASAAARAAAPRLKSTPAHRQAPRRPASAHTLTNPAAAAGAAASGASLFQSVATLTREPHRRPPPPAALPRWR